MFVSFHSPLPTLHKILGNKEIGRLLKHWYVSRLPSYYYGEKKEKEKQVFINGQKGIRPTVCPIHEPVCLK